MKRLLLGLLWLPIGALLLAYVAGCQSRAEANAARDFATSAAEARPVQQEPPMPATLMRRLSTLAGAVPGGGVVYVVVSLEPPHQIEHIFRTREEADRIAAGRPKWGVYPIDLGAPPLESWNPCPHDPRTTKYGDTITAAIPSTVPGIDCANLTGIPVQLLEAIREVTLTVVPEEGDPWVWTFSPHTVDAIFFTVDAFERFALPYYSWVYGPRYGVRMGDAVAAYYSRTQ